MSTLKVLFNEDLSDRFKAASEYWESYAAWNKCLHDERIGNAFIAGYISGWDRNDRPPLPIENIVPVDF